MDEQEKKVGVMTFNVDVDAKKAFEGLFANLSVYASENNHDAPTKGKLMTEVLNIGIRKFDFKKYLNNGNA